MFFAVLNILIGAALGCSFGTCLARFRRYDADCFDTVFFVVSLVGLVAYYLLLFGGPLNHVLG